MRLGRRQRQVSLDRFLVKVAQKEKESTDSSDSVSDNESRPTQHLINSITLCILNLNNQNIKGIYVFCINHFYMNIFLVLERII
jgi:hypothetical protein